ncbi:N-acetylneuraminate synthase family protein [Terasakiella sp. SH-1]|uniref:N-acetylneuraminate synthase family protein n=1 Tax=Terasakiella sp. SH-1 TaxID=2560057 RepID=UPI0010735F88|nr:N-acetylneuraminate synthase family protein [Terasakiella sp. SH-1]
MIATSFDRKIIAEIGSVHDGSFGNALKLIELAAKCGADIVKFQTHIAEAETLPNAPMPPYFKGEPRLEYFKRTAFSIEQWEQIVQCCSENKVQFLSSPFSLEAVDLLEKVNVSCYKVASGEVSNTPLLKKITQTGKPVLLSSGMSNWQELGRAITALSDCQEIMIMQCTSAYPCPPTRVGLNIISEMTNHYKLPVGFSDHTTDCAAAFAAAALGAVCIEKHLTFSKAMYGSDAANAMEPEEFTTFCRGIKSIWKMLDNPVNKDDLSPYLDMKKVFEKSIVTTKALGKGDCIQEKDLSYKKPGDGIAAWRYNEVLSKKLRHAVPANHQLSFDDFE